MVQAKVKEYFGKEPHKGINPDEVVAIGAAIQAGVLGGQVDDVLLLDVTPLTLGIETLGGVATPLIPRNTTVPTRKSQVFSTASDSQTQVQINVVQGERPMARDNKQLGTFNLDGIPAAPRGVPQIEVTFDIDADGILHVSAQDKATSREQKIIITASSGLTKEEIDKMVRAAEQFADEDRKRKDEVELRNEADTMAWQADKTLRDLGDKVPAELKGQVEEQVKAVRDALAGSDQSAIRSAKDTLMQTLHKVGEAAYQQQGGTPPPGGQPGGDDEGTVDGEFREV
jgi:molecular chaperone DnaK